MTAVPSEKQLDPLIYIISLTQTVKAVHIDYPALLVDVDAAVVAVAAAAAVEPAIYHQYHARYLIHFVKSVSFQIPHWKTELMCHFQPNFLTVNQLNELPEQVSSFRMTALPSIELERKPLEQNLKNLCTE